MLQPIAVIRVGGGFTVVAGNRRLAAAKLAGLDQVPVRVLDVKDDRVAVIQLVENLQREALDGGAEVAAVAKLVEAFGGSQVAVATAIGKSKTFVSRCVKAAKLLPDVSCAGATLSKSALFELADSLDPKAALAAAPDGKKESIREARAAAEAGKPGRQPSGPLGGDRFVAKAIQYKERKNGSFTVRVNYAPGRTPPETILEIVRRLEEVLQRLKAGV